MIPCIGLASGLGGSHEGSGKGPTTIQQCLQLDVEWKRMIYPDVALIDKWDQIPHMNKQLAEEIFQIASQNPFTMVIGGDHSCGIGTWSGIAEAMRAQGQDLALLWFDAHMDSHSPETSESGNIHGMPLATLLGYGSPKLTQILSDYPKIKPENLFLIGIRSYEEPERKLLEKLNVRVYYIEEVQERGLRTVLKEIIDHIVSRQLPYGISVDIDFFDPQVMTATGTPEKGGPQPEEFLQCYDLIEESPPVAFEFVEYNPPLDRNGTSLAIVGEILQQTLKSCDRFSKQVHG